MLKRALFLVVLCTLPAAIRATVIVPAEFREIVNGSDIIAYGRVIETTVQMSDDRKRVDTLVTMQVGTYLKGGPGDTIVFRVPGGQVGRFRNVTVGAPQFAVGEEAVVFLHSRTADRPFVFGLNQGVFRVRLDDRTRRRVVMPPVLMAQGDAPEPLVRGSAARRPVALETFGAQVQSVLAEADAARRAR
ncbi:MAG: hypothetical protein ACRD1U_03820 [Vicinamibacterales bacterium]